MLQLESLAILEDNYIWVLHDGRRALAVDPGDGEALQHWLDARALQLETVLVTHHHHDHVDGLEVLCARQPDLPVYGPARVARVNRPLRGGETVDVLGATFEVLALPGHTLDHVGYYSAPWLFCGDTLFGAGCGRLFEGSPEQMVHSLAQLAALPPQTLVCCTHEYTLTNLRFACQFEPDSAALAARWQHDHARREQGQSTLPSTIARELQTNPFLRAAELAPLLNEPDALAAFTRLRQLRNGFR